ncbi:unnamed protein product [Amoebophrya sp. A120]|nr:unnamed protein product [Amoebophrya sp. A120]|eukprot:GSA120T00004654001.1
MSTSNQMNQECTPLPTSYRHPTADHEKQHREIIESYCARKGLKCADEVLFAKVVVKGHGTYRVSWTVRNQVGDVKTMITAKTGISHEQLSGAGCEFQISEHRTDQPMEYCFGSESDDTPLLCLISSGGIISVNFVGHKKGDGDSGVVAPHEDHDDSTASTGVSGVSGVSDSESDC